MHHPTDHPTWSAAQQTKFIQAGYWQPWSLGRHLSEWANIAPHKVALTDGQQMLSYQQLDLRVSQLAAGLADQGITAGDRVLLQLPNSLNFVVMSFALFRLGAVPVLTMPAQREADILALCAIAEPVAYVIPDRFAGFDYREIASKALAEIPSLQQVIVDCDQPQSGAYRQLSQLFVKARTFAEPDYRSTALLLLSGGTTGTPKLIPRTHADYAFNARASAALCQLNADSTYLAVLPAAHNFTLACPGILGTLSVGGKVVLSASPGNDEAFPLIAREQVTFTSLVPPLLKLWLEAREWDQTDISSLKFLQVGGARCPIDLAQQVEPVFDCTLQQVFGMAEGLLCFTRLDDPLPVRTQTQGRPLCPADELRIIDAAGLPVATGEIGELLTRGPYTILGYYRASEHNSKSFTTEGFYQTGDLVRRTADGNLVVVGRLKEQINRAGEKIAVAEMENVLSAHPAIDSVCLVPVPDAALGERSCAFVMSASRNLTLAELCQFLHSQGLPRYKWPDQLEFISFWPLTAVGKIDKKELIRQAQTFPTAVTSTTGNTQITAAQIRELSSAAPVSGGECYLVQQLTVRTDAIELALALAKAEPSGIAAVYERQQEWWVALGQHSHLCSNGRSVTLTSSGQSRHFDAAPLSAAIEQAMTAVELPDWRAYGLAQFELCHFFHPAVLPTNLSYTAQLLELFVPLAEVCFKAGTATVRALDAVSLNKLVLQIQQLDTQNDSVLTAAHSPIAPNIKTHQSQQYLTAVRSAVAEIQAGHYQKVILSRQIPLPSQLDIAASFRLGRSHNTPARSFYFQRGEMQLAGFSPETVLELDVSGRISTQPLAGTRALGSNPAEEQQLKTELLHDTKEIAEHAVSVLLAQQELRTVCDPASLVVSEFMTVRRRGSVQHLASRVSGLLSTGKTGWDAFAALFPAVTASGIPKAAAIDAIRRLEPQPRQYYSGCALMVDAAGSMDAALILRSMYRLQQQCWLQAGAGIIDQSQPERELTETIEKLSCLSAHLVSQDPVQQSRTPEII